MKGIDRIHLTKHKDKWWSFPDMVMNLGVP
jgi:hypothetical protein